jgi:hypothetical protein
MAEKNFTLADLETYGDKFLEILQKHGLADKKEEIFSLLAAVLFNETTELDLPEKLQKQYNLDFQKAAKLAYELKINIIDQKAKIDFFKNLAEEEFAERYNIMKMGDEILDFFDAEINPPGLKNRFYDYLASWLKGDINSEELKNNLIKSIKIGGLGMPEDIFKDIQATLALTKERLSQGKVDINKIVANYEASKNIEPTENIEPAEEIEVNKEAIAPVATLNSVQDVDIDVSAKPKAELKAQEKLTGQDVTIHHLLQEKGVPFEELNQKEAIKRQLDKIARIGSEPKTPLVNEIEEKEEFLESKEEIEAPEKETIEPSQPAALPQMPKAPQPQPASQQINREINQPLITKTSSETSRPKMEDVRVFTEPQLVGPVDELAGLKIEDFRHLSRDPNEAANKIMAKLELLEDESVIKKVEGIKALKISPLYKDYAEIMNQAIKEGKSIEEIINAKQTLTQGEFKAIMQFNKELKY